MHGNCASSALILESNLFVQKLIAMQWFIRSDWQLKYWNVLTNLCLKLWEYSNQKRFMNSPKMTDGISVFEPFWQRIIMKKHNKNGEKYCRRENFHAKFSCLSRIFLKTRRSSSNCTKISFLIESKNGRATMSPITKMFERVSIFGHIFLSSTNLNIKFPPIFLTYYFSIGRCASNSFCRRRLFSPL